MASLKHAKYDRMTEHIGEFRQALENLLDDRDYLFRLLDTINWDAQLDAIRVVLARNRAAADVVTSNIKELEEEARTYRGPYHEHIIDEHVDAIVQSSYSDAAVSLSAVGMIVPMMESVFRQSFQSLGSMYTGTKMSPPNHHRWQRARDHPKRWDCQLYFGEGGNGEPKSDIISGIRQLSEAAGLLTFLEPDTMDWIEAMLTYRNRMFHGGFEWSLAERERFETLIAKQGWEHYFKSARTNGRPWIFYLRDDIIDEMPRRMEGILDSFGRFTKNLPFELVSNTDR